MLIYLYKTIIFPDQLVLLHTRPRSEYFYSFSIEYGDYLCLTNLNSIVKDDNTKIIGLT